MRDLANLRVYEPARRLTLDTYRATRRLPRSEEFGLKSQIRRASISVVANIVEGHGRGTDGDFERYLRIASGSLAEMTALTQIAADLGMLDERSTRHLIDQCEALSRMLVALTTTVSKARR